MSHIRYELRDGAARVVVLRGEGTAFSLGGDVGAFAAADDRDEVHPDDELDAATDRVVAQLLAESRTAQMAAKRLLREVAMPGAEGALRRETLATRTCATSPDGLEGVATFIQKRPADFNT